MKDRKLIDYYIIYCAMPLKSKLNIITKSNLATLLINDNAFLFQIISWVSWVSCEDFCTICTCWNSTANCSELGLLSVPDFMGHAFLTELDLSRNKIRSIPANAFQKVKKLELLDITYNDGLTLSNETIHDEAFSILGKLHTLNLVSDLVSDLVCETAR